MQRKDVSLKSHALKKKNLKQKNPFIFFILDLVLALPLADSKEAAPPFCGYSNNMILSSVPGVAVGSPQSVIALQVFHIQPSCPCILLLH